jgi:hypothetical protein
LVLAEEDKAAEAIGVAWRTLGVIAGKMGRSVQFSDWATHQLGEYAPDACFQNSLNIFADPESDMEHRARTLREWARYKLISGDRESGENLWLEARGLFETLGAQREVERMQNLPQ